jgi:hypothetical protein
MRCDRIRALAARFAVAPVQRLEAQRPALQPTGQQSETPCLARLVLPRHPSQSVRVLPWLVPMWLVPMWLVPMWLVPMWLVLMWLVAMWGQTKELGRLLLPFPLCRLASVWSFLVSLRRRLPLRRCD